MLELDVRMTRDGVLVVLHDATLERTVRAAGRLSGRVADLAAADLCHCDAGSWFNEAFAEQARPAFRGLPLPTLEDVLRRYGGRARYLLELKDPETTRGMEARLVELLRRLRRAHGLRIAVQSFSAPSLKRLRALAPWLPLVQLYDEGRSRTLAGALDRVSAYAAGIGPAADGVDAALVASTRRRGLAVFPWTVDDVGEMRRLIDLGVDGVVTNRCEQLLEERGRSWSAAA